MKALILAGGMGTRLRTALNDRPKPMADVSGSPFLLHIINQLKEAGIRDILMSIGYRAEIIKDHFGDGSDFGARISYSEEAEPLGTGGALQLALDQVRGDSFLVMNGDSHCQVDFEKFFNFHYERGAQLTMVVVRNKESGGYGVLDVDEMGRVARFYEKEKNEYGLINAGIYLMNREIIAFFPGDAKFSLEYDLFPKLIGKGFYAFITDAEMIDIGTPERYAEARDILGR